MSRFFLACTPRTGNHWFRRLLAETLSIPVTAEHTPTEIAWQELPPECIVSMHWRRTPDFCAFLTRNRFEPITTIRHPLDVLISILHFSQYEPATARWLEGAHGDERMLRGVDPTSAEFLEYALSERTSALLSVSAEWMGAANAIVRYEDLVADTEPVLTQVLADLAQTPKAPLQAVIENHTLSRLQDISLRHFWKGTPGLWKELIPQAYAHAIFERHQELFETLGYNCDCPSAPTMQAARERWQSLCEANS